MDGFELLGRLRAMPQMVQTPVVVLTAMGSEEDVARGFERGADEYIVKPFAAAEVRSRVRRLVSRGAS
jgi:DNA-binding response OmpR family regulator